MWDKLQSRLDAETRRRSVKRREDIERVSSAWPQRLCVELPLPTMLNDGATMFDYLAVTTAEIPVRCAAFQAVRARETAANSIYGETL
jgi:hypothetical protein